MLINGNIRVVAGRSHGGTHYSCDRKIRRMETQVNDGFARVWQVCELQQARNTELLRENNELRRQIVVLETANRQSEQLMAQSQKEKFLEQIKAKAAQFAQLRAEKKNREAEEKHTAATAKETQALQEARAKLVQANKRALLAELKEHVASKKKEKAKVKASSADNRAVAAEAKLASANRITEEAVAEAAIAKAERAEETLRADQAEQQLADTALKCDEKVQEARNTALGLSQQLRAEQQKHLQTRADLAALVQSVDPSLNREGNIDVRESILQVETLKKKKADLEGSVTRLKVGLAVTTPLAVGGVLSGMGLAAPIMQGVAKTVEVVKNACTARKVVAVGAATTVVVGTAYALHQEDESQRN